MLDNYINEQPNVYRILKNTISKNRLSHAYLFETNGYVESDSLALAFAKYLFCPNNYSNKINCVNCTQCQNIDKNIFSELKIIEPDGMWIKKEQIAELQSEFKTKSVISNKKIYIIKEAEKLNTAASNSILKFLEEPNSDIIAILITNNIHQLLDTIVSRCQIISFKRNEMQEKLENILSVNVEDIDLFKNSIVRFINNIEEKNVQALLNTRKLFLNIFEEKNELISAFELMILYYKDLINNKLNRKTKYFEIDNINNIIEKNTIEELNRKIKVLMNLKEKIYINANTNLLIDRLILDLGGYHEHSRSSI